MSMNERAIFDAALDYTNPVERVAYLDQACGANTVLRRLIDELLAAQDKLGSFLASPPAVPAATEAHGPPTERPGTVIGPYKLLQQIGEGGMGVVYMAEQQQPIRRKVALKIIKPGMDSAQVIARFEAERQALALMDHQNIAKVLDAGTTESGRPYFVMELVKGVPITRFCDEHQLTPRQRLELFIPVCHAVQHAHQKGIIHRDLKPSNVLVALYDDQPVPKVIDFGVAKATSQKLTDRTLFTAFGSFIGTLEYMSPEQAKLNALDIDTRSDVYALGVLLYELLTGNTPLEHERLKQTALDELLRIIREEEPPRPSTRLSYSSEKLATISAQRGTEPAKLGQVLRGELDWIIMRALEKERTRRYETANGLARDLQHYLADESVEACPPTARYRLRKFARKHKVGMATAVGFAVLLLLGVAGSAWQAVRATAARQEAWLNEAVAQEQKRDADDAKDRAEKQRDELAALNDRLRHLTYVADMNLARHAWDENDPVLARDLLERHRPKPGETDLRGFEWRYLRRLSNQELLTVNAHAGMVKMVAYTADGKRLVSVGSSQADGKILLNAPEVKLWDAATGKPLPLRLKDATDKVCSGALSPNGKLLAAGCRDRTVRVWDLETGELIATLKGHTADVVSSVTFSPDGKHLASRAHPTFEGQMPVLSEIRIWDLDACKAIVSIDKLLFGANRLAFSPDGKRLASSSDRQVLKVWDTKSGGELLVKNMENPFNAVAFSPDGKRLAVNARARGVVATLAKGVRILDAATGELVKFCPGDLSAYIKLAFSPDGKQLAAAGLVGVELWNVESGQLVRTFKGHQGGVWDVVFSPNGRRLASAGVDGSLRVWDTAGPRDTISISTGGEIALSPDGRIAATGRRHETIQPHETIQLWNAETGERLGNPLKHEHTVINWDFTADGKRLALADEGKNITIWDVTGGKVALTFKHDGPAGTVPTALSPDGKWFACPGPAGAVKVWNAVKGLEYRFFKDLKERVHTLEFSPDGTRLVAGYTSGVKIWDLATGREICTTDLKDIYISFLRFSPDGKQLAVAVSRGLPRFGDAAPGMQLGEVRILDAESGREVFPRIKGHAGGFSSLSFSPDGKRVVTGDMNGTAVKIWDVAIGQETLTLKGHTDSVSYLAFSPDGHRLISAAWDGTVRTWDATPLPEKP
jgi:WD40 repeat protein/serine/threonine protein kinase